MEGSEDITEQPATTPVFVDDTGRRRALARRAGRLLAVGFVGYLGLLGAGFAHDPRLGPLALPTFGLPSLVHTPQPPASVLGEATTRTASDGGDGTSSGASKGTRAGDSSHRGAPARRPARRRARRRPRPGRPASR